MTGHRGDQDGGVGVLLLLPAVVAAVVALVVATAAGSVLLAAGRAQDVADEAALAAARAVVLGDRGPCDAAAAVASATPGVAVVTCERRDHGVVEVAAVARVGSPVARRFGAATRGARAAAGAVGPWP